MERRCGVLTLLGVALGLAFIGFVEGVVFEKRYQAATEAASRWQATRWSAVVSLMRVVFIGSIAAAIMASEHVVWFGVVCLVYSATTALGTYLAKTHKSNGGA